MNVSTPARQCMWAVTLNRESISAYRVLMGKFSFGVKERQEMKCDSWLHTVIWDSLQSIHACLMYCTTLHNFRYHSETHYKIATRKLMNRDYIFSQVKTKKEHNQGNSSSYMFCTHTKLQQAPQFRNRCAFFLFLIILIQYFHLIHSKWKEFVTFVQTEYYLGFF